MTDWRVSKFAQIRNQIRLNCFTKQANLVSNLGEIGLR